MTACAYCRCAPGKVNWRGELLCCACVGAVVRFVRELNELPTYTKAGSCADA